MGGGAWPFLVGGAICLVNSDNERDSGLLTSDGVFSKGGVIPPCRCGVRGVNGGGSFGAVGFAVGRVGRVVVASAPPSARPVNHLLRGIGGVQPREMEQ